MGGLLKFKKAYNWRYLCETMCAMLRILLVLGLFSAVVPLQNQGLSVVNTVEGKKVEKGVVKAKQAPTPVVYAHPYLYNYPYHTAAYTYPYAYHYAKPYTINARGGGAVHIVKKREAGRTYGYYTAAYTYPYAYHYAK